MAFLHSVIGDNTIENREHLTRLGYQVYSKSKTNKYIATIKSMSMDFGSIITEWAIDTFDNYSEVNAIYKNSINCIGKPQLFKAVSAMRSDSDYMQWFTCKVKDGLGNELPDSWVLCTQKTLQDFGWVNNSPNTYGKNTPYHKATLSELEAHLQRV